MCPACEVDRQPSCSNRLPIEMFGADKGATRMGTMTYYVALAFMKSGDDGNIVACDPKEARSPEQAIRTASSLAKMEGHCGAIAFSRTGDPALGDFEDAVILKAIGEVDAGLLSV
jgi:hypothetical protein